MGQDEEGTIRVLAAHRAIIDGIWSRTKTCWATA